MIKLLIIPNFRCYLQGHTAHIKLYVVWICKANEQSKFGWVRT